MSTPGSLLAHAFGEGRKVSGAEVDPRSTSSDLENRLAELVSVACAAWPDLALDPVALARYVGERVASTEVDPRRGGDFAIAWACAAGSAQAIAALDRASEHAVRSGLRRLRMDEAGMDETRSRLRIALFVPRDGRPAHIASWSGRGDLLGWIRVCAVREGLKVLRRTRGEGDEGLDLAEQVTPAAGDPHEAYELRLYAPLFREALAGALASLEPRERALLAQHHLDGLSIDRLAVLHGVHRATAARWVNLARERLIELAQTAFRSRTQLEESACASVMRRIRPEIDLTLRRVLEAG